MSIFLLSGWNINMKSSVNKSFFSFIVILNDLASLNANRLYSTSTRVSRNSFCLKGRKKKVVLAQADIYLDCNE